MIKTRLILEAIAWPRRRRGRATRSDHEAIIQALRTGVIRAEELGDQGTADLLTGFMESHTKMAWMLRATAQGD